MEIEILSQYITLMANMSVTFFVARYVFMLPQLKWQNWYYLMTLIVVLDCNLFIGYIPANIAMSILIMINLFLSNAEKGKGLQLWKRILGVLHFFPVKGICDGLMLPLIYAGRNMGDYSENHLVIQKTCVGLVFVAIMVFFGFGSKKWRNQFSLEVEGAADEGVHVRDLWAGICSLKKKLAKNPDDAGLKENLEREKAELLKQGEKLADTIEKRAVRKLERWEKRILVFVGILMLFCSDPFEVLHIEDAVETMGSQMSEQFSTQSRIYGVMLTLVSFCLTFIVVVLILQGNRRSYYHNQLSGMQLSVITTMADIVENRDENTGGHIHRTAGYVEIIAKRMKKNGDYPEVINDRYIEDMIIAAPLHDIGKIHIPDAILNKPDRLTDEEFKIMKTHAEAGRELLKKAGGNMGTWSYLDIAVEMAGSHHEWWDGSTKGYPDGIKGEEIPVCARIMAVADVFDALVSKRIYKPAMPTDKAFAIIEEESGTHFDPVVVKAFLAERENIEKVLEKFNDEYEPV